MCIGGARVVVPQPLERRQLRRLVLGDLARATQSPTTTCTGAASAAIVSGIASAVRS